MADKPVRYTRNDMDDLLRATIAHRSNLVDKGLVDAFGTSRPPAAPAAGSKAPEPVTHKGYCMKCKTKVDAVTERVDDNPNGSMHARGKCSTCGTGVHSFHSAADGQKLRDALESNRALTGGTG